MQSPLSEVARGRWAGILPALGVSAAYLRGKHGPCPLCGEGKDRWRWDDKDGNGTWICSHCGAGNGFSLVMKMNGWDYREAAKRIEAIVGTVQSVKPKAQRSDEAKREAMNRLWRGAKPIETSDPVGQYLRRRVGMSSGFPACLRYAASVLYKDEVDSRHPAMLAKVSDAHGRPVNVHRTYLTPDGQKADVPAVRRMMEGSMPKGSAVRLMPPDGDELGIAEGIETALSASSLFGVPCWAALNAHLLANWSPPEAVQAVVVFGDCDASFAGQTAAYGLASRLAGHFKRKVRVEIPPGTEKRDWNNVLHEREAA